ncbi:MAG: K(+)-transporting ATPase subunit C [Synechococcaceae cyanobacterium SM2_3_1]|nr:K(+)-transporting ATPase subunit C [Synechococcaceae cyanobacterium SM2_3_1]
MIREMRTAILSTLSLFVLTAVLYPALLLGVGLIVPVQASGSLIDAQGNYTQDPAAAVGSALIGQPFTEDQYFWSRPSVVNYSSAEPEDDPHNILKTGVSGASNYAPSNPALIEFVEERRTSLRAAGFQEIPPDLVYTSGSGLDPHISLAAAQAQLERVAAARNLDSEDILPLIEKAIDHRFLGIFGEPGVNVLRLNLTLDQL